MLTSRTYNPFEIIFNIDLSLLSTIDKQYLPSNKSSDFNCDDLSSEQIETFIINCIKTKMEKLSLKIVRIEENIPNHPDCIEFVFVKQYDFNQIIKCQFANGKINLLTTSDINNIISNLIATNPCIFPSVPIFYLLIRHKEKNVESFLTEYSMKNDVFKSITLSNELENER